MYNCVHNQSNDQETNSSSSLVASPVAISNLLDYPIQRPYDPRLLDLPHVSTYVGIVRIGTQPGFSISLVPALS